MARKKKTVIDDETIGEYTELDQDVRSEDVDEPEAEDVEETQELSFGDDSYRRLSELADTDEWN
jgi:hypothetical protein